jgi:hypothetical protein
VECRAPAGSAANVEAVSDESLHMSGSVLIASGRHFCFAFALKHTLRRCDKIAVPTVRYVRHWLHQSWLLQQWQRSNA